jgi:hypothetical protein
MAMSDDDKQTMTIDGRVHTYMTNTFVDEADKVIAALVEKGVPGKLRPGRSYVRRAPGFSDDARGRKKSREARRLGIVGIWLVGEIEEADRTYRPSPPPI